ncbi:MAG: hypothetical protein JXA60_01830 [Candidatus Coatesbacteria bacterium]|nr:hypothetical protein [Candidatus Coatesbacteria bacterium]
MTRKSEKSAWEAHGRVIIALLTCFLFLFFFSCQDVSNPTSVSDVSKTKFEKYQALAKKLDIPEDLLKQYFEQQENNFVGDGPPYTTECWGVTGSISIDGGGTVPKYTMVYIKGKMPYYFFFSGWDSLSLNNSYKIGLKWKIGDPPDGWTDLPAGTYKVCAFLEYSGSFWYGESSNFGWIPSANADVTGVTVTVYEE